MLATSPKSLARLAALLGALGVALLIAGWTAGPAQAELCPASPGSCPHPVDDVLYAMEDIGQGDPPPPPPDCPLDPPAGYFCTPGPSRDFVFESADPENPQTGDNRCIVRLEGATPPDQMGTNDVQYRTTVICQKALRAMTIDTRLYTASLTQIGAAPVFSCHALSSGCPATAATRGGGSRAPNTVYVQRATVRMVVPESDLDPWITVAGEPAPGEPSSCTAGREDVKCVLTLEIPVRQAGPDIGPLVSR